MEKIVPVVLAGGSGTRLWPLSRKNYPKQFLNLHGDQSMLQQTFGRLKGLNAHPPLMVVNETHRFVAAEQVNSGGYRHSGIILEPESKNTAPAAALAAFHLLETFGDPLMLVVAADHYIADQDQFHQSILDAINGATHDHLMTFGIVPTSAETGFGYIRRGAPIATSNVSHSIDAFIEKPDPQCAQQYLDEGGYLWNSGMFLFRASVYLEQLKAFQPSIYQYSKLAYEGAIVDLDFIRVASEAFNQCPSDSIDYAVMENTDKGCVVSMDAGWSDLGTWASLWALGEKTSEGNTIKGDVLSLDTQDSLLYSSDRLITTLGVKDMLVVETRDAVLVADKSKAHQMKQIIEPLMSQRRAEIEVHRRVHRPWGYYDLLDQGLCYQVKSIRVNPGAKLSLQKHQHRAEHWVVVKGTAKVTIEGRTFMMSENESTYVPIDSLHALENPTDEVLDIIEVQSGNYLSETDIIRVEDWYGRT